VEKFTKSLLLPLAFLLLTLLSPATAKEPETLVGANFYQLVRPGDTLIELARHAGVGYGALIQANPGIDPWQPPAGTEILVPRAAIVPYQAQAGITVNLAEQRLYLIQEGHNDTPVRAYPIGIGREGYDTPTGQYRVVTMVTNPNWTPPPSVRAERPGIPAVVPPGPDNPLGNYWIGLSDHSIGLHGTNRPYGIGRHVSSGCIRLYPEHISILFRRVHIGMPVKIIDLPIKLGQLEGRLYLEAHPDPGNKVAAPLTEIIRQRDLIAPDVEIDWQQVRLVLDQRKGVPHPVSTARVLAEQ
jgi:L,D-transpeptidase ErfK/SrfK